MKRLAEKTDSAPEAAQGDGQASGLDLVRSLRKLPRVVWLLSLASLLNDVSSEAIFPLLPVFLTSLGAPMRFIGLIEGSADALSSVIKLVAGRWSDRGPRRALVATGYLMPALARAAIAGAPSA